MNHFGTDGIRGKSQIFTADYIKDIATAIYASSRVHRYVIGRDTRIGGENIAKTIAHHLVDYGAEVYYLAITPTPVVSLCTQEYGCYYGIMISASHNPPDYNGIKIFNSIGAKLSEEEELELESLLDNTPKLPTKNSGAIKLIDGDALYLRHICTHFSPYFAGKNILIDCACGATFRLARSVFNALGANVTTIFDEHDGKNINCNCGATAPSIVAEKSSNYDFAFAFDGDGDRIIAYANGKEINGDHILYIIAKYLKEWRALPANAVVGTIMSNIGLDHALRILNIDLIRTQVGDQHVFDKLCELNASVGGENSGHIILRDYLNTGDGIFTAVMIAKIGVEKDLTLYDDMKNYPQYVADIITDAEHITAYKQDAEIRAKVTELDLNINGRLVVRASGTEPKIRIMAEAQTLLEASKTAILANKFIKDKLSIN